MAGHVPSKQLLRRHAAAMAIVHTVNQDERVRLLMYVLAGSERINDAVEAAEQARVPLPHGHRPAGKIYV
jgi:hypothetical protein